MKYTCSRTRQSQMVGVGETIPLDANAGSCNRDCSLVLMQT